MQSDAIGERNITYFVSIREGDKCAYKINNTGRGGAREGGGGLENKNWP